MTADKTTEPDGPDEAADAGESLSLGKAPVEDVPPDEAPPEQLPTDTAEPGQAGVPKAKKKSTKEQLRAELVDARSAAAHQRRRTRVVAAALVAVLLVMVGGGLWLNHLRASAVDARARVESAQRTGFENLAAARAAAEKYTEKAINIDFNHAADYVAALAEGTTKAFGDTFSMDENGAGKLIVELQKQLRMTATGEVVYTLFDGDPAALPKEGQPWNFVVIANQTSSTAQRPDRTTQAMVLKVVVVQVDGAWKVSDFGPDAKTMGASTALPGVQQPG